MSAYGTVENAIEGMKLGAYDFLLKPASADDLAEKIKAAEQQADHAYERQDAIVETTHCS